jgi:hypothetical protein
MNGQRARRLASSLDRLPTIPKAPKAPAVRSGSLLRTGWAVVLGLGWPISFAVALALEPAPAQPEAAPPSLIIELTGLALFTALVTTSVAAAVRHRAAATAAGVVVGLIAVTTSVICPVSGHHAIGTWWFAQLGLMVTMLAASVAALGHWARTPD